LNDSLGSTPMRFIDRLNLEAVLNDEKKREYESLFDRLWFHLVQAHDSHRAWEIIESFPIEVFCASDRERFLHLVKYNFARQVALAVINALTDEDPRALTFSVLTQFLIKHCKKEARHAVTMFIRQLGNSEEVKDLLKKAKTYRSKRLAHFDMIAPEGTGLSLYDMKIMLNQTEDFIQKLGIANSSMNTPEYSPFNQSQQTDIEYLLCLIVKDFKGDQQPEVWSNYFKALPLDLKLRANDWRRRAGLPEWD